MAPTPTFGLGSCKRLNKYVVLTLGTDIRQQLGQRCVRLGHVIADEDRDDAVELLSVFLPQYRDGLQDQLHLLQLVGS